MSSAQFDSRFGAEQRTMSVGHQDPLGVPETTGPALATEAVPKRLNGRSRALHSVRAGVVLERIALLERIYNLEQALKARTVIGQAQGILMERHRLTAAQAFDRLRVTSEHLNRKLRDVAADLVHTGEEAAPMGPLP